MTFNYTFNRDSERLIDTIVTITVTLHKHLYLNNVFLFFLQTYGVVRVPLFTMGDGIRGFPAFLANHFAGNAREELLMALSHCGILTVSEIQTALVASEHFVTNVTSRKS